jgi:tRNA A37 N6-isopentenylltransferase MiaA
MRLARMMNAEIVSCDSMQVYRGMDILTSKPLLGERARVKHHLLSFVPVSKEFNVTLYRAQAVRTIDRIIQKGKTPLLVGGTGLYLSVLLDGIFDVRAHDDKLRERLARQAEESGSAELHRILSRVDPVAASRIHPHDARRIIRALEVYQVTGERISEASGAHRGAAHGEQCAARPNRETRRGDDPARCGWRGASHAEVAPVKDCALGARRQGDRRVSERRVYARAGTGKTGAGHVSIRAQADDLVQEREADCVV